MSIFTGTATLTTTNSNVLGPYTETINLNIFFSDGLTQVSLGSFPQIFGPTPGQAPIQTPLGNDTFTITMKTGVPGNGLGTFVPTGSSAGMTTLNLAIHLHNSVSLFTAGDEDSDMAFTGALALTTETCTSPDGTVSLTGSRYDPATGAITLVGAAKMSGGYLGGSDCGLTITGTLTAPVNTSSQVNFGDLATENCQFYSGNFTETGQEDIVFYHPSDHNWWIAQFGSDVLNWSFAGNTQGFGQLADGQHFFWKADFNGDGRDELLFYYQGDDNWWHGTFDVNGTLTWTLAGNTRGFGHAFYHSMQFWMGDFQGLGKSQILFYFYGDGNWWLGTIQANGNLTWENAGNTQGFGPMNDNRPFWVGDFKGLKRDQVLFYYPGDNNWWLGTFDTHGKLTWNFADNTNGFGNAINRVMRFFVGDFQGIGKRQILFYYYGDSNWWLGTFDANGNLTWKNAGNTQGFGPMNDSRPFWEGNFSTQFRDDVLFYYPGDGNWWDGTFDNNGNLSWKKAGNTIGFGNLVSAGAKFFIGDYSGSDMDEVLFYHPSDGHWFLSTLAGGTSVWSFVSNTSF
jgi:hypothetical protein